MTSKTWNEERVAETLLTAEAERNELGRFTDEWPELDVEAAYRTQQIIIDHKVANGETIVGVKLGLTSRAKQKRMGISSPLTAVITDRMVLETGAPLPFDELIHPRVEPEIVFIMAERLEGPGVTGASAMAAVGSVHAGLEVIDSRYRDFSFALSDVIADNASSARLVVGADGMSPQGLDLLFEACVLRVNGEVVDTATGASVQGHPAEALALAANELAKRGGSIEAGSIVLTGGLTDAVFVAPGDEVSVEFTSLGSVTLPVRSQT